MQEPNRDHSTAPTDPGQDSRVDQTELVAHLADELRASEDRAEMLTYALGSASHDLNNLRTAVAGYAEIVLAEAKAADPVAADFQEIIHAAERMVPILRRMWAFAGRPTSRGEWCDLAEVVSEAVAEEVRTRPDLRLQVADVRLAVNLPPDRVSTLVREVLSAAQSAAPTGPIEVELRAIPRLPSNSVEIES
jgi:signal transduction histidine kinase